MSDEYKPLKEFISKYPKESGNWIYQESKKAGLGIRKQNFYGVLREVRNLPEPTIQKRKASIPIKYKIKPTKPKVKVKPSKIPFEKTKFGKIVGKLEKAHNISEEKAIKHARKILKIPKSDYRKMNQKDVQILLHETP